MGNKAKTLDQGRQIISEKLQKVKISMETFAQKAKEIYGMSEKDLIEALLDKQTFKEVFLFCHSKMYNLLQDINTKVKELRGRKLNQLEIEDAITYLNSKKYELAESRMEVYFCNVISPTRKFVKFWGDAVMKFGTLHVGILVDDICIQWGRGIFGESIVQPSKTVHHDDYIFAIELENLQVNDLISETFVNIKDYLTNKRNYENMGTVKAFEIIRQQLDGIAEISVLYNGTKNYNLIAENCQGFVKAVLKKIGLQLKKTGEVGKMYKLTEEKAEVFDFTYNNHTFKTRKDLDDFVLKCNFQNLPEDHRKLLYCFRNVFEYYGRYKTNDDKYKTTEEANNFWKTLIYWEKFENSLTFMSDLMDQALNQVQK